MKCCCCAPNVKPPCHRRLVRQQVTKPCLHPITIPSLPSDLPSSTNISLAPAAARRTTVVSSSNKALCRRHTAAATTRSPQLTTTTTPPQCAAPEDEALPSSYTSSSTPPDGYGYGYGYSRRLALAAATLGIAAVLLMAGVDGRKEALALGPEGPLVEEFWDNVRRYGVYILTVSTGAIYTILQPIVELLKNPISAILILLILGGSFYLLSQVLSFMFGINEFSYDYAN